MTTLPLQLHTQSTETTKNKSCNTITRLSVNCYNRKINNWGKLRELCSMFIRLRNNARRWLIIKANIWILFLMKYSKPSWMWWMRSRNWKKPTSTAKKGEERYSHSLFSSSWSQLLSLASYWYEPITKINDKQKQKNPRKRMHINCQLSENEHSQPFKIC